jgi:hypothetical protein
MIPLAANWTGGSRDGIGYYNPRDGWSHLRAGKDGRAFRFGPAHMVPVAGDWPAA